MYIALKITILVQYITMPAGLASLHVTCMRHTSLVLKVQDANLLKQGLRTKLHAVAAIDCAIPFHNHHTLFTSPLLIVSSSSSTSYPSVDSSTFLYQIAARAANAPNHFLRTLTTSPNYVPASVPNYLDCFTRPLPAFALPHLFYLDPASFWLNHKRFYRNLRGLFEKAIIVVLLFTGHILSTKS